MFKLLALLLILVILFGVEATRAFIFGSFSLIVLVFLGLLAFCFLVYVLDALGGKTDNTNKKAEEKKIEKNENKEDIGTTQKTLSFWFWVIFIVTAVIIIGTLTILLVLTK